MTPTKSSKTPLTARDDTPTGPRLTGTVDRVFADKGFSFVLGSDGQDYFLHKSAMVDMYEFDTLAKGDKLTFEGTNTAKGRRAANAELVR